MKKILSVLLASLLLLSTSATAFAMETETNADNWLVSANQHQIIHNAKIAAETGQNVTLTTKILSDLSDNHFELVEVGDTGYMIFDPQSASIWKKHQIRLLHIWDFQKTYTTLDPLTIINCRVINLFTQ